jgi:branched-chain amino acid transport system substrate-binding protein
LKLCPREKKGGRFMERIKGGSKRGRKLFVLLTIIFCFGIITLICPMDTLRAESKLAGKEVRIGAAWGLTGMWRDWTTKNEIAAKMAIEEINAMGGIGGVPVRLIKYDTTSKPMEATRMVRKLADDDKVLAILGPFSSSECEVAFPVGKKLGIAMISQASSKPGLAKPHRPYAFRNTIDEIKMGIVAVKAFIKQYNVKKVAVVHDIKDAIGLILGSKVLPTIFKKMGVTIVNEGAYTTYQTKDFDFGPQVTKLKGMDFDGIAFGGVYFDAITFSKELRRQGLNQKLVGGSPFINEYFPKRGGEAVEGTFAPCTFHHSIAPTRFVDEFIKRAKAKRFDPPEPIMYDNNVYDAIYFIKYAIEKMGVTNKPGDLAQDREKIMKGLSDLKDFRGIVGPVRFNAAGDGDKPVFVAEIKGGRWVIRK